jgi:hypothetical protein
MVMKVMKAMKKAAVVAGEDVTPALKVMRAMKAKQVASIAPSKFAGATLGAKRANDKRKKAEEQAVAKRKEELEDAEETTASDDEDASDEEASAKKAMKATKATNVMKTMKATKVAGKFAKKALGVKRTNGKNGKANEGEVVAARTAELKTMSAGDLKDLVLKKGLQKGLKGEMIESVLAQEAKGREASRAYEAKVRDVTAAKKKEIESKTLTELKELCEAKKLKSGGSKPEKVERLLAAAKQDGEIETILAGMARAERRQGLIALSNVDLQAMCKKSGIDPLMKEVMVDRIIAHEALTKP